MDAPRLYREYLDSAVGSLYLTGHQLGHDTILIGEFAPEGLTTSGSEDPITPMPLTRALYCVDSAYRPLRGATATALGCPVGGSRQAFVKAHPGLLYASGFAHHPYYFFYAPNVSSPNPNFVPIVDLGRLERGLDRSLRAWGMQRRIPLYLTERASPIRPTMSSPPSPRPSRRPSSTRRTTWRGATPASAP
jgi:hypothetical protein